MKKLLNTKSIVIGLMVLVLAVCTGIGSWFIIRESKLNDIQQAALEELDKYDGEYDTNKLVLTNTSYGEANTLASQLNATLRLTMDGKFATLTLPNGVTVRDVYAKKDNRQYLSKFSLDVYSRVSEEETSERLPAAPNYTITDAYYSLQSYINYLHIGNAWNSYKGNGITVAVIDTGIDYNHSEFTGRISEYSYNATEDKIVKDYNDWSLIEDEQGHGTSVAGVIAASMDDDGVVGVAPNVNLLVIKAECNEEGQFTNTSDLVFGLYYAIERDVDIVNMSFGGYSNSYASATKLAVDSDIICVAAAGNDGTTQLCYPAADENVIGVGALAQDSWELASYSNYGENVNMVAPGTVYTTKINGGYGIMNGTSFASPITAAVLALYKQQNKYCEFADVCEILYASCYDLGSLGNDWYFGYGALDVNALLCEEKGTVTFNMLTDELDNTTQKFIRNHTLQNIPEPERNYAVFDGWYYDIYCTEELELYSDVWTSDLTLYANWVNENDGVPYTYVTLPDNTIEIRSYTGKRRYITIPEMIDGKVVSSIGDFAFSGQSGLREVNLPAGLTNIGLSAFRNCNNLVSISIPENVYSIGSETFYNNVRLSSVVFSGNSKLKTVGGFAFAYSGLSRFELPAQVTSIDGSAFFGAGSLTGITVNKNNSAFKAEGGVLFNKTGSTLIAYPVGLKQDYTVPSSVRTIGEYAFGYTKSAVNLGDVQSIGKSAFAYSQLNIIDMPNSVTSLGEGAFACNFNLSEVTIGNGVKTIPSQAFSSCTSLKHITIPAQVISIGSNAFADTLLTTIEFTGNSQLNSIGSGAFSSSALKEIIIPDSVSFIGGSAFAKDTALARVVIGENSSLQVIGGSAFSNAISLAEIYLPSQLMQIGNFAFSGTSLVSVTIPASVSYLGTAAFAACHSLSEIKVESNNENYIDINGVVYNKDLTVIVAYPAGNTAKSYTVESTVTTIAESAFYGSWNLTSVSLPQNLTEISRYAFYDCEYITTYNLPKNLTYIEAYAFANNKRLSKLTIPDEVMQISNYAFAYDYSLTSITFNATSKLPRISFGAFAYTGITSFRVPSNVSTIAQGAFIGCSSLTSITFAANSKLESISAYMFDGCTSLRTVTFENGSALTSIQAHGFEGTTKLQTVNFGNAKLTNIDNYAFRFCENLQTIKIPEGVTYIGRFAFYGATKLARLDLPESIDYIGRYAFYGADNLKIYFASEVLPDNLQENWDNGISGYYVGVTDVASSGDWDYAVLKSGGISLIKYKGAATELDLTNLNLGGDILSIGGYCFYFSDVNSVILPETLTTIQNYAFARSQLESIIIPVSVQFIGQYAFFYTPLKTVTFAENGNLRQIEQYAFSYTRQLDRVVLPASLEIMGSYAFYESGITALVFADDSTLTEIPQYAFASTKLVSVVLPDSVTLLNHNAFRDCTYLQSVSFGSGEIYLMSNVFYNTGLTELNIPANLTYIGEYSLVGLQNLAAFNVDSNNPIYSSIDGLLYSKDGSKLIAVPAERTGEITLPETLEIIGFGAFENTSLSEISFNENSNILTFGYRAFYGAKNLTEITIPASVVSIDYYAFAMCKNLQTVNFVEGNKLTGVYEGAFYGCNNLKNIVLPDSIVEISDFAFYGCSSLTRLPISETSQLKGIYSYAFAYTGITNLTIPDTVIDIGDYAFRGAPLVNVIIPDANEKQLIIGLGAFAECNNLVEINLPFIGASFESDVYTWFGYIFGAGGYASNSTYVPESLKIVTITEGISFIGKYAFYELSSIEAINVPHSVNMLNWYAFYGTTAKYELTNIIYVDGKFTDEGYFGKGISGDLVLGKGLTEIFMSTFKNCSDLASVVIPDSVAIIDDEAFYGCSSLTSITLPSSVTKIGGPSYASGLSAFAGCINLYQVINYSDLQLTIGSTENGYVAYYAKVIIDKNGNKTYKGGVTDFTYIDTADNFRFMMENGQYKLIAYLGSEDTITLPAEINGESYEIYYMKGVKNVIIPGSVISVGEYAFRNCSSLTSVVMLKGVTTIGYQAFRDCSNLKSIVIPDSVKSIGTGRFDVGGGSVFSGCSSLKSIVIPNSVKTIERDVFGGCSGLESIVIPDSVTYISSDAFYNCSALMSIVLPNSITAIYDNTFSGCNALTSLNIPNSVRTIGYASFQSCSELTNIVIPNSVTSIGSYAFNNCSSLTSVVLSSKLMSIQSRVFSSCGSLSSIVIPDSVTSIGERAFYGCSNLTNITIPTSVTDIGSGAFSDCTKLNINFSDNNQSFTAIDGVIYNKTITKIVCVPDSITSIIIPATVLDITSAFDGNKQIQNVSFENGSELKSIGEYAFRDCSNLTSIVIPEGVTLIGSQAFHRCSSLKSIIIPDGVVSIGDSAFRACRNMTNISIPEGVVSIESETFSLCSSLPSIAIPEGVISIGEQAFSSCSNLTNIEIPNSVTSIGSYAFNRCDKLYLVNNYSDLDFTIGSTENGYVAYYAKVIIDKNGNKTYKGGVTDFTYIDTADNFRFMVENGKYKLIAYLGTEETVTLPIDVKESSYDIYYMEGVKNVIVPGNVTYIGGYAFRECNSLTSIVISNGVKEIESFAFSYCSNLTSIEIPDSVTSIGSYAFSNTAYYKEKSNWTGGCLYIGNALIKVDPSAKYMVPKDTTTCIADGAFSECNLLVQATVGGNHSGLLNSLSNLETLIITEMPTSHEIYQYFGWQIPITLKNIVIKECTKVSSISAFKNLTSLNTYVEANKMDCPWDEAYPGWNNGNKVYYGGEWISAEFYGIYSELIDSSIYLTSQVVRQPYYTVEAEEGYTNIMSWDLDGDGIADTVPATSGRNIKGYAIVSTVRKEYTVKYYDKDGQTVLYAYILNHGDSVPLPDTPEKRGYAFLGWNGYVEGMTVTENIEIYSAWKHNGEHVYVTTTVESTCTNDGHDLHTCEVCGESYRDNFAGSTGHSFGEWVVQTQATCTQDGLRYHTCSNCNEVKSEVIAATGHNYVGSVTKQPTCSSYGTIAYTCSNCGDTVSEQLEMLSHNFVKKTVSKTWLQWLIEGLLNIFFGFEGDKGYYYECANCRHIMTAEESMSAGSSVQGVCVHNLGDWLVALAATCENQGINGRYCTICGELIEAVTLDAIGHNYSIEVVAPTCTEEGYDLHTCSACGTPYKDNYVDALGHDLVHNEAQAATCTESGWKAYDTCSRCDYTTYEEIVALNHNLVHHEAQVATCTDKGWKAYDTCSRCDYTTYEEIAALGHDIVHHNAQAATCTENGWKAYDTCSRCDYTTYEEMAALNHDLEHHEAKAATCIEKGWKAYDTCSRCDYSTYEEVLASGHNYELNVTPPTCTEQGYTTYTCTVCGDSYIDDYVEARHIEVKDEAVLPTCNETGLTEGKHCSVCGEDIKAQEIVAALGHTVVTDKAVLPTCTETGLTEGKHCSVCEEVIKAQEVVVALGHDKILHAAQPATCTEIGWSEYYTCSRCDYTTYSEIDALGHSYGEWTVSKESTLEQYGEKYRVCSHDDTHIETQQIEKRIAQLAYNGGKIMVSQQNGLAPDVELVVTEIAQNNYSKYEHIAESVNGKIGYIYDIKLITDGDSIQPDGTLIIKLLIPENLSGKSYKLFHLHGSEATDMEYSVEDNYVVVTTNSLSEFIFVDLSGGNNTGNGSGLSGGALAGILIGSVIGIAGLAGIGFFIVGKKRHGKKAHN